MTPGPPAPAQAAARARWPRLLGGALLAVLLGAGALRAYLLTLPKQFVRSALVAEDIVHGEPPWRMFQSRVLGPYLVHALGSVTHTPPAVVYGFVALALLFAAGFLILELGGKLADPARPPLTALFAYQALLMLLLPCLWLYAWDLISLVVFVLFNHLVLSAGPRRAFVALFAVAIFNHEIALWIAVWMALDPIVRRMAAPRGARPPLDRAGIALGVAMLAAGAAVIELLRRLLLVREVPPPEADALTAHGSEFHLTLARNWDAIAHSFTLAPQDGLQFVVPLFLALVLVLAARLAGLDPRRLGALAIVTAGMVASFLCFGLILETRVLLPLVPFVAMNLAAMRGAPEGARAPRVGASPHPRST